MAREDGTPPGAVEFLQKLSEEPWRYGFFQTVRRLDCLYSEYPATGRSFRPADDPLRFSQEPYAEFAPSTLNGLTQDNQSARPRLSQRFLGLFGPDGPLPIHLTEYARDRSRQNRDPTFARFADIFHHRMIALFYRAWANSQPTVQMDRKDDRFSVYLGSLIGWGSRELVGADEMHYQSKLAFAGHLGSLPRHPAGLESIVREYFEVPAFLKEFIGHWLKIPQRDHLELGREGVGALGMDTVLGERAWQRQDKFRIVLGPLSLDQYTAFLPSGKSFKALVAAVRDYVGMEMLWEINLVLEKAQKPVACLGKSGKLGWTSWLESKDRQQDVDDLLLQVQNYVN
jgi:type VI secretion system protein ImpH